MGDLTAFRSAYGTDVDVAGVYEGRLGNSGELIVLELAAPHEAAIVRFAYSDAWQPATDGGGKSLAINDPAAAPVTWSDPESWYASDPTLGRP